MPLRFSVILTIAGLVNVPMTGAQGQLVQEQATLPQTAEQSGTLAEIAPGQVVVSYENGELAIKARNVALLEVLRQICTHVGADIDAPAGASEPVFVDLGPGPVRQVLSSLLAGSQFNYALQAAEDDPNVLARLILFPMSGHPDTQNRGAFVEASAAPPSAPVKEAINPKETVAQMKDLLAEAKGEMANLGSDEIDPSVKEGAAQLFSMLENSMETLAAKASESSDQPIPSAPPGTSAPTGRSFHRRR
jgi:hypothetical protein